MGGRGCRGWEREQMGDGEGQLFVVPVGVRGGRARVWARRGVGGEGGGLSEKRRADHHQGRGPPDGLVAGALLQVRG